MSRSCTVSRINKTGLPKSAIQCKPEGKANYGRPVKISAQKVIHASSKTENDDEEKTGVNVTTNGDSKF
jgi:hypothetical protein